MTYNTINNDVTIAGGAEGALGRIDKYELKRELGEGGFGTVYLAHDTVADVDVAVKGLPPEVKHNAVELESIRGNFALVKRLRHPNIVAVTDLHQALSVKYASKEVESKLRIFERDTMVVMDYAPGVTLAQWRRQFPDGKVPLEKAVDVVRQVASALDYAHGQKVLHRDVKPANVMVETSDGGKIVARVLDFGLAAEIRSSMGRLSREIRDTSGTRPYMAPEQWKGDRQGPATDQYALAAMFCELVAGEVPFASVFDCGDPAVMRLAVTADAPKMPSPLPKNMRKALAVALAKKPEERFATCGDFVAALEGRKVKVSRRGGRAALVAAAMLAALVVVGWWFAWRDAMPAKSAPPAIFKSAPPAIAKPAPAEPEPVSAPSPVAPVPVPEISLAHGKAPASDPASVAIAKPAPPAIAEPAPSAIAKPAPAEPEPVSAPSPVAPVPVPEISLAHGKAPASDPAPVAIAKPAPPAIVEPAPSAISKPAPAEPEPVSAPSPVAPVPVPEISLAHGKAPASDPAPPTLTVSAELNGRKASGARMQTLSGDVFLPYDWPDRLTIGRSYGPYLVYCKVESNYYYGSFKIDGVNWNGHTNITVRLGENWPEDVRRPPLGIQSWAL